MFSSNSCAICGDSISDPVCRGCYIKQTEVLLNDLNLHFIAKEIILNKIKNRFPLETTNETFCVLCKRENVALCRYCFSIILLGILRELNFSDELIENFKHNLAYEEISLENEMFVSLY